VDGCRGRQTRKGRAGPPGGRREPLARRLDTVTLLGISSRCHSVSTVTGSASIQAGGPGTNASGSDELRACAAVLIGELVDQVERRCSIQHHGAVLYRRDTSGAAGAHAGSPAIGSSVEAADALLICSRMSARIAGCSSIGKGRPAARSLRDQAGCARSIATIRRRTARPRARTETSRAPLAGARADTARRTLSAADDASARPYAPRTCGPGARTAG
jgi:hypothetical protein